MTHAQARAIYNRIGALQDTQRFYEDAAVRLLVEHADLGAAQAVIEFGCGTGRHAATMLREHLPQNAHYVGIDQSQRMVQLSRERLRPWTDRSAVWQSDGRPIIEADDQSFDRFWSTYVLDLLSPDDIVAVLDEAHRLLRPGGRLCLASLTLGDTAFQQGVSAVLRRVYAAQPALLGGCRPLRLRSFLDSERWSILFRQVVSRLGIPSEVIVATPIGP